MKDREKGWPAGCRCYVKGTRGKVLIMTEIEVMSYLHLDAVLIDFSS
jgi:hypothetical protein